MHREVTLSVNEISKTYQVDTDTHYEARAEALRQFLEECHLPGRPADYIVGRKKGIISISVKSAIDRRTIDRDRNDGEYFRDQIERMRSYVRLSEDINDKQKTKATKLLLDLEEVLSG